MSNATQQTETLPTSPDWLTAPEWALWFAIDKDGKGCFYGDEPECYEKGWDVPLWTPLHGLHGKFDSTNWQNSLQQRPA